MEKKHNLPPLKKSTGSSVDSQDSKGKGYSDSSKSSGLKKMSESDSSQSNHSRMLLTGDCLVIILEYLHAIISAISKVAYGPLCSSASVMSGPEVIYIKDLVLPSGRLMHPSDENKVLPGEFNVFFMRSVPSGAEIEYSDFPNNTILYFNGHDPSSLKISNARNFLAIIWVNPLFLKDYEILLIENKIKNQEIATNDKLKLQESALEAIVIELRELVLAQEKRDQERDRAQEERFLALRKELREQAIVQEERYWAFKNDFDKLKKSIQESRMQQRHEVEEEKIDAFTGIGSPLDTGTK